MLVITRKNTSDHKTRTCCWNQKTEFRQIPRRWWIHQSHDPSSGPSVPTNFVRHVWHSIDTWHTTSSVADVPYAANLYGCNKSRADPASYRGIYLSSALAKLFEGIFISWLTKFTETHNTLTENQLGIWPGWQIHDAIYSLLSIIRYNITQKGLSANVAFCDFSTAFPSIHRGKLLSLLCKENIVGQLWKHLTERFQIVEVRVLHPRISKNGSVAILRGVPEGRRLSPTLFQIFVVDLIHELRGKIPNPTITHNGGFRWIW